MIWIRKHITTAPTAWQILLRKPIPSLCHYLIFPVQRNPSIQLAAKLFQVPRAEVKKSCTIRHLRWACFEKSCWFVCRQRKISLWSASRTPTIFASEELWEEAWPPSIRIILPRGRQLGNALARYEHTAPFTELIWRPIRFGRQLYRCAMNPSSSVMSSVGML